MAAHQQFFLYRRFFLSLWIVLSASGGHAALKDCRNPVRVALNTQVSMSFCEIPFEHSFTGNKNGATEARSAEGKIFQMGQYTVTQQQFKAILIAQPWPQPWKSGPTLRPFTIEGDNYPANYISYTLAMQYVEKMNRLDSSATYRLPTAVEFEYAARAGSTTDYYWGNSMDPKYAFFSGNSSESARHPREVTRCPDKELEQLEPGYCSNKFGLMHMAGNIWQVLSDDLTGNNIDRIRATRGGSWYTSERELRLSYVGAEEEAFRAYDVGFRLVRIPKAADPH